MYLYVEDPSLKTQPTSDPTSDLFFDGAFSHRSKREGLITNYGWSIFLRMPEFLLEKYPDCRDLFSKANLSVSGWDNKSLQQGGIKMGAPELDSSYVTSMEGLPNQLTMEFPHERGSYLRRVLETWSGSIRDPRTNLMTLTLSGKYDSSRLSYSADFICITTTPDQTNFTGPIIESAGAMLFAVPTLGVVLEQLNRASGSHDVAGNLSVPFTGTVVVGYPAEVLAQKMFEDSSNWFPVYKHSWQENITDIIA